MNALLGWSEPCKTVTAEPTPQTQYVEIWRRENIMDFGIILLVSNALMAMFLYIVVKLIWQ
jgi:hypothetical protein